MDFNRGRWIMRYTFLPVVLAALMAAAGCARSSESRAQHVPVPEEWQWVEVEGVAFALPQGLEETGVRGVTGVLRQYDGLQLQVNVHAGDFASTLREFESAAGSYEWLQVDGRRARGTSAILDDRAYDGLYVPEPGGGREPVSILVISLTPEARQHGMLVLRSVRFP
jgi:hypothetical protein